MRQRPSRSLLTGVLGVVVMLAALLVAGHLTNPPAQPTPPPRPATATTPPSSQPTSPAPAAASTGQPQPPQPPRLHGGPLAGTGLTVLLVPAPSPHGHLARFVLDTGQTIPVGGLPAGGCFSATRLSHAWVLQRRPYRSPQASCQSPWLELYLLADGAPTAIQIGSADGVVPAADGSGVWLITDDRPPNPETGSLPPQHLHKVTPTGQPLTPSYPLPAAYAAVQGLGGDLLLLTRSQQGPTDASLDMIWSAHRSRVLRRVDRVLAASATTIAWIASSCGPGRCPVHLSDLTSGHDTTVPAPPGAWATSAVFSPDGRQLAMTYSGDIGPAGRARSQTAVVVDTTTRRLLAVPLPGSRISADLVLLLGWSPDSAWLLVVVPAAVDVQRQAVAWQLGVWRPGDRHLRVPHVQPPAGYTPILGG